LSTLFVDLVGEFAAEFGLVMRSPADPAKRGAHVSFAHESGYSIIQNLIARGIIGDFRAPDNMRFGFSPLFMRYTDCFDAAVSLHDILASRSWEEPRYKQMNAVT
jgi:kynureninase